MDTDVRRGAPTHTGSGRRVQYNAPGGWGPPVRTEFHINRIKYGASVISTYRPLCNNISRSAVEVVVVIAKAAAAAAVTAAAAV